MIVDAGVEHVLVDGMNLLVRCHRAMARAALTDRAGRSTGALYAFLRSLGSYRARFPRAEICVAWDGSAVRRHERFEAYKAARQKRVEVGGWNELAWLKNTLLATGVAQAFSPEWEADDVVATLVRGKLAGKACVIVSTDRDFLQLLGTNVRLLVPPPKASGEERIFETTDVEREWGVPTWGILTLRSLDGDVSDELPGVARVPTKFLAKLVRQFGSLVSVHANTRLVEVAMREKGWKRGLKGSGWTKGRVESILAHREQALLNLELMTLESGLTLTTLSGVKDEERFRKKLESVDVQPGPLLGSLFGRRESVDPRQQSLFG
jgi:5'-3' exonuclease